MIKSTARKKIVPSVLFIVVAFLNTGCGEGENEVIASGRLYKQIAIVEPTPTPTPVTTTVEESVPIEVVIPEPTATVILVDSPYGENVERWRSDVRGALAE